MSLGWSENEIGRKKSDKTPRCINSKHKKRQCISHYIIYRGISNNSFTCFFLNQLREKPVENDLVASYPKTRLVSWKGNMSVGGRVHWRCSKCKWLGDFPGTGWFEYWSHWRVVIYSRHTGKNLHKNPKIGSNAYSLQTSSKQMFNSQLLPWILHHHEPNSTISDSW